MEKKPLWSCVTYNFNDYEKFYELPENVIDENAEYIYITNNKSLTSSTWTVVYKECDDDPFYAVCDVRYHIFDYINSDIAVMFDGSMRPINSLERILDVFNKSNYDFASIIHPTRNTAHSELTAWVNQRGMSVDVANKALNFMYSNGYDVVNYRGLFQINFMVVRKTEETIRMLKETFEVCKILCGDGSKVFRCDQVVISFVINTHFTDMKIMPVGQYICNGMFFNWYAHNTDNRMECNGYYDIDPFVFDKQVYFAPVWC